MTKILVTGSAGFIGFHVTRALLEAGHQVVGIDSFSDYYDPALKQNRVAEIRDHALFSQEVADLEDAARIHGIVDSLKPQVVFHFAAQAGVRYSIDNPRQYISSNVLGTQTLFEALRYTRPHHVLVASTSSVYGGNEVQPFRETDGVRSPMSLYAATKVATEALAHSYAHLYTVPVTCFRFFTVYGPWGRPDMALFKFVDAIDADRPIEVYGHGQMARDFTYVDDLVAAVIGLSTQPPVQGQPVSAADTLSPVAPYRIVNIAGGSPVQLMDFITAVEHAMGKSAKKHYLEMQPGDVVATWADPALLTDLIGQRPSTPVNLGVKKFVDWYRAYNANIGKSKATDQLTYDHRNSEVR